MKKSRVPKLVLRSDNEELSDKSEPGSKTKPSTRESRRSMTVANPIDLLRNSQPNSGDSSFQPPNPGDARELLFAPASEDAFPLRTRHVKEKSQDLRLNMPLTLVKSSARGRGLETERVKSRNNEIEGRNWSRGNFSAVGSEHVQKAIIRNSINVRFMKNH